MAGQYQYSAILQKVPAGTAAATTYGAWCLNPVTNPVTIVDMIVRGTVDRKIIASFNTKETIAQMVMRNPSLIFMDDE